MIEFSQKSIKRNFVMRRNKLLSLMNMFHENKIIHAYALIIFSHYTYENASKFSI